jgi:hypothetical protein
MVKAVYSSEKPEMSRKELREAMNAAKEINVLSS